MPENARLFKMKAGEVDWSLPKMTQTFTGYLRISFAAVALMFNKVPQESIFEKIKEKNMTSLAINGAAIYGKLFLNYTKRILTEGGNIEDFTIADS